MRACVRLCVTSLCFSNFPDHLGSPFFLAGNETNSTNSSKLPDPVMINRTVYSFQIQPGSSISLTLAGDCSTLEVCAFDMLMLPSFQVVIFW